LPRSRTRPPYLDQHLGFEAVREHQGLGAAVVAGGKQFERSAVGLWAAA
jgi:hypothetical protein